MPLFSVEVIVSVIIGILALLLSYKELTSGDMNIKRIVMSLTVAIIAIVFAGAVGDLSTTGQVIGAETNQTINQTQNETSNQTLINATFGQVSIDTFDDGVFLDSSPFTWSVPTGGWDSTYNITNAIVYNGTYSLKLGVELTPTKYATPIDFKNDTWYFAHYLESGTDMYEDHSMLELFYNNLASILRVISPEKDPAGQNDFRVIDSSSEYLAMDGQCNFSLNTWYLLRMRRNSTTMQWDAEVWNHSGLVCWKYGYVSQLNGADPTSLRLLNDEAVLNGTYWDDVGWEV